MPRISFLLKLTAALALIPFAGHAQKCLVSCGTNASGEKTYLEVYEYDYVTSKPTFPGGDEKMINFINSERVYPREAYRRGYQGRVICSFVVNTDGSISNINVLRGVEPSLNSEAVRVLSKMPQWQPGKLDGKTVPVRVISAIAFRR